MNTRRRNERGPSSQQAQVFQKGEWPTATEVAQLAQDVPVVLRGFGNNMSLVQKLETDAYLATLNINEKLTVKKGVHESGDPNALPAFDHASTTGLSLSDFLAVYRKPSTMVPYLAAYGENYDVAKVDTDRASYLPKKRDPFRGELRSILPRVAKDSSPAAVNDDERLDPRGHFSAVCSALKEEGYQCSNVALWFSGRPVTTPLHYDDYATVSILGGSGEKEWFLAPPEASPLVRGPLRFRTGYLANTSGFKPWLQPTASSSSSSSSCRGLSSNRSNSSISSSGSSNISSSSSGSWEQQEEWPASLHNNSDGRGATHSEGPLADADAARDAAAHACFRSVTVGLGDLLLVPPKWWHAVVTRGRCLAANWWFTPPDKHALEVARLAAAEAASREDGSWPCQKCSTMNDAPVYGDSSGSVGGGGGLVPGQSPACVLCSHVKGSEMSWRCRRPECGLDNETALSKERCPKAAICVACNLPRGADPEAVTEEDIQHLLQTEATKKEAAASQKKRAAAAADSAAGTKSAKMSKKAKANAQKVARANKAAMKAEAAASAKAAGPWTCSVCTLENRAAMACEACGTARAFPEQPSATSEPATADDLGHKLETKGSADVRGVNS